MTREALHLWNRAVRALHAATLLVVEDPDSAASRAYYAAFHAVSAVFALQGRTFRKHTAVEAAVHRDLVRKGLWVASLGEDFSALSQLRYTGDYGGEEHVTAEEAEKAVGKAQRILQAARQAAGCALPGIDEMRQRT